MRAWVAYCTGGQRNSRSVDCTCTCHVVTNLAAALWKGVVSVWGRSRDVELTSLWVWCRCLGSHLGLGGVRTKLYRHTLGYDLLQCGIQIRAVDIQVCINRTLPLHCRQCWVLTAFHYSRYVSAKVSATVASRCLGLRQTQLGLHLSLLLLLRSVVRGISPLGRGSMHSSDIA